MTTTADLTATSPMPPGWGANAKDVEATVHDLVDQLTAAAGVRRPSVYFQPWFDDNDSLVTTDYYDSADERTRIVITRPAVEDLSPSVWRHLLADQVSYLRFRQNSRFGQFVDQALDHLDAIAAAVSLVTATWYLLRTPSTTILIAGLGAAGAAALLRRGWCLYEALRADRYAVRLADTRHGTVDELHAYLAPDRPRRVFHVRAWLQYVACSLRFWCLHLAVDQHESRYWRSVS